MTALDGVRGVECYADLAEAVDALLGSAVS